MNECKCETPASMANGLVALANKAANLIAEGNWAKATDVIQGELEPLKQRLAHEVWLRHHKSGTMS